MKKILLPLFLFLGLTFNCFSQIQLQVKEIYPDSLSVLNDCKWQLLEMKFKDTDQTPYQMFLDLGTVEIFMIFRKREKFAKVIFK